MNFIKKNKGVLLLYLLIASVTLLLVNQNKNNDEVALSGYDIVNGQEVVVK